MQIRRTLCLVLAMLLLISGVTAADGGFPLAAIENTILYPELIGHWAGDIMLRAVADGIIEGYVDGTLRPDRRVTRAELAAMLSRQFDWQERAENRFADVDETRWDADVVLRAAAAGVIHGDNQTRARPLHNVTREEAVVMISRAYNVAAQSTDASYPDADEISPWAFDAVASLTALGAVRGRIDGFKPREHLTRAEAVTMLTNLRSIIKPAPNVDESAQPSEEPTNPPADESAQPSKEPTDPPADESAQPSEEPTHIIFGSESFPINPAVAKSSKLMEHFYDDDKGRRRNTELDTVTGIDVSAWQGEIDWQAVADDGIEFAIIRVGYRGYTVGAVMQDDWFQKNAEGAIAAGIDIGVYFFSQAITVQEAIDEADFVLDMIDGYDITYPVVFDWENVSSKNARTNNLDATTLTDCAVEFCERVRSSGYTPAVYFYMSLAYKNLELERLVDYDWWLAQYHPHQTFYYDVDMWQYTSSGTVSGIEGDVDMNISYVRYNNQPEQ